MFAEPLALGGHRPSRTAPARRSPGISRSTSPSSARATPGCGPPTTSPRPTRRCGSPCSRPRSRGSAPAAATAAGAPPCSPRRCPPWPSSGSRESALAQHAAMRATVDEVGRVARGRGHRRPLRQGRHLDPGPLPRPAGAGPGPRSRRPAPGAGARTTSGCWTRGGRARTARRRPTSPGRRTRPTARRCTRCDWSAAWPTRSPPAGSSSTSTRRSARSSPAGCRPIAARSAPRPRSCGRPRATPPPCPGTGARWRRSTHS